MLRDVMRDLRHGLRQFARAPMLTTVAVLTLAIGIGATTAIFSLLDAALLEPLPVPHADELRNVIVVSPDGASMSNVPSAFFDQLRDASSFSGVCAFWRSLMTVGAGGESERIPVQLVSGGYYATLGVRAFAGRLIDDADERDRRPVAVVSYAYWRRRFGSNPSAIGQMLTVDGAAATIVGVTPPEFFGTDRGVSPDVTLPLTSTPRLANLWVTVRVKPGVSDDRARADTGAALGRAFEVLRPNLSRYRPSDRDAILGERADVVSGDTGLGLAMSPYVDPLRLLMVLAAVVLLIACVNIANLLLARSAGRSREMIVRLALGASRGRLVRQMLAEHALLATAGAAGGLAIAGWIHRALVVLLMDRPAAETLAFGVNTHVLAFAAALLIATLLVFGVTPAIRATSPDGPSLLQRAAPVSRGSRLGLLKGLIVVQAASAVLLLFCAGLLVRTFENLGRIDTGVAAPHLLMMRLGFDERAYDPARAVDAYGRLGARVESVPGVESVAFGWDFAFGSGTAYKSIWAEGQPPDRSQNAGFNVVGPGFFATAGIPLVAGREFSPRDIVGAPKVVIVNEAFARRYYPGRNPVGRHLGDEGAGSVLKYEVVGVVKDTRTMALRSAPEPMLYQPLLQDPYVTSAVLHVRTHGDPRRLQQLVEAEIHAVDPSLPVYDVTTLDARRATALDHARMMATLAGFFGILALVLMAFGVYGVIAYAVSRRTVEIGLRLALGATPGQVRSLVLRDTLTLMAAGGAVGVPASFLAGRLLETALFGVTPQDPVTAVVCGVVLIGAGGLAGYLPARRAARLEPMTVLRT
jgi:putative ABC transport system permease protein